MGIRFNPVRDTLSAFTGWALGNGGLTGLLGTAAKKAFIRDDSSRAKKFGVGLLTWFFAGIPGVLAYLIAGNGGRGDVQKARNDATTNRYSS